MRRKLKVAVAFNEAHPEYYVKHTEKDANTLGFTPYFEVDNLTPIEEYELLAKRLSKVGIEAYALNILDDLSLLLKDIKKNKPDVIFNFIEIFKENARLEMNIVGLLELMGIPYTGAPPMALANCQSKILAKRLLNSVNIPTPRFLVIRKAVKRVIHDLNYPIIVKPAYEDASVGIENESIVTTHKALRERIEYVHKYFQQPALLEEFIEGRELNVAMLGDVNSRTEKPIALPISEIDFREMPNHLYNIVSYQAKWDPHHEAYHKTIPICPAVIPKKIEKKAKEIALKAFRIMSCRDYARVDMRLAKDNKLYVLEVNPNPDLTEGAGFMRSAEAAGYSYIQAMKKIIRLAYHRGNREGIVRN